MDKRWRELLQLAFGMGLTFLFFYMLAPFIVACLIGSVVAIILYPLYRSLKTQLPPWLAAFSVVGSLTVGILLPIVLLLYTSSYKVLKLAKHLEDLKEDVVREGIIEVPWLENILSAIGPYMPFERDWMREQAIIVINNIAHKVSSFGAESLTQMPTILIGFLIVQLSIYFFLIDGAYFLKYLGRLSPLPFEKAKSLYQTFELSCRGVVAGTFLSALFQGSLMGMLFYFCGLSHALLAGSISVGMGMVPIVGTSPIWIGAFIYLLSLKMVGSALIMLIGGIVITVVDQYVRASAIKEKNNMHPFLILISVFGAVNFIGAAGVFLGPIIAAVFVAFLNIIAAEFGGEKSLIHSSTLPPSEDKKGS